MSRSSVICLVLLVVGILLHWYAPRLSTRTYGDTYMLDERRLELLVFLARLLCVFAAAVFGGLWIKNSRPN